MKQPAAWPAYLRYIPSTDKSGFNVCKQQLILTLRFLPGKLMSNLDMCVTLFYFFFKLHIKMFCHACEKSDLILIKSQTSVKSLIVSQMNLSLKGASQHINKASLCNSQPT